MSDDDAGDDAGPKPKPVTRPQVRAVVAVVLAGGDATDRLASRVGALSKALVPLKGRPLGAYVLDALQSAESVGKIVWVGATDAGMRRRVDLTIAGGPRLADSLALGLGAADAIREEGQSILFVTADLPWLRGSSVDRFVAEAAKGGDLVYPVVDRAAYEATFPTLRRTWVRLADGHVTGGNLLYGSAAAFRTLLPFVDLGTRDRKAPLLLAWRLGVPTLLRFVMGRATLHELEARLSAMIGVQVRAPKSDDPVLGTDVDGPDQLPATLELADLRWKEHASE